MDAHENAVFRFIDELGAGLNIRPLALCDGGQRRVAYGRVGVADHHDRVARVLQFLLNMQGDCEIERFLFNAVDADSAAVLPAVTGVQHDRRARLRFGGRSRNRMRSAEYRAEEQDKRAEEKGGKHIGNLERSIFFHTASPQRSICAGTPAYEKGHCMCSDLWKNLYFYTAYLKKSGSGSR